MDPIITLIVVLVVAGFAARAFQAKAATDRDELIVAALASQNVFQQGSPGVSKTWAIRQLEHTYLSKPIEFDANLFPPLR